MISPLDIPELAYMIINLLDLKSIIRILQINWHFKYFVQDMPIYRELLICQNYLKYTSLSKSKYNIGEKIFISACANNCLTILRNLEHKIMIKKVINKGLRKTCENGHLKVAKFLVEKGADIHIHDNCVLVTACENGHLGVAKFLMDKGVSIRAFNDCALWRTCSNGHLEMVKFLVDKGANIHVHDDYALMRACFNGHLGVVKFLVEKGANIHASNNKALRWACKNGHLKVVKFLVEKWSQDSC